MSPYHHSHLRGRWNHRLSVKSKQCVQFHPWSPGLPVSHLAECTTPSHWAGLSALLWGQGHEPILTDEAANAWQGSAFPSSHPSLKGSLPQLHAMKGPRGVSDGHNQWALQCTSLLRSCLTFSFFRLRNWVSEKSIAEDHSWTRSLHVSRYLFLFIYPAYESLHVPIFLSVWNLQSLCLYILSLHHFIFSSDSRVPVKCARLPLSSITVYIFFFLVPVPLFQTLL